MSVGTEDLLVASSGLNGDDDVDPKELNSGELMGVSIMEFSL